MHRPTPTLWGHLRVPRLPYAPAGVRLFVPLSLPAVANAIVVDGQPRRRPQSPPGGMRDLGGPNGPRSQRGATVRALLRHARG